MTTIAARFEIESVAGEGGMGTVYRARDLASSTVVALKIVRGSFANARFEREAMLLSQIEGEGIVRYVAHGRVDADAMFLAMEWLEGESLDARLARADAAPLTIKDCLVLGKRLACALAVAHGRGVVHRDVKPSNVIMKGGDPAGATLVDFGIARALGSSSWGEPRSNMTATGAVIGTPQYMAPEQARGETGVDARADVFSLGCVLFECLTGRAAFVGAHMIAVLAKILLEPAGRVRELRKDVPAALDDLVARMLEKLPAARPADGSIVAGALDGIRVDDARTIAKVVISPVRAIGATERRLATVILARTMNSDARDSLAQSDEALRGLTREQEIIDVAGVVGVTLTALANGTLVGAVVAEAGASNAAERAARCALALHAELGTATIALATGRAVLGASSLLPVGEAIDAAAILLDKHNGADGVWLDEATESMLEGGFTITREAEAGGARLRGERPVLERERVRTVMGREVACVGRTRELALLEATFRECVEEPIARAMLVIAPPGIGKTRLRRELTSRIGTWSARTNVWLAAADPVMQSAPYALVGDLLRRSHGGGHGAVFDSPFLSEIAGVPSKKEDNEELRAARRSPELMRTRVVEAMTAFLHAELQRNPLLLVLEDVHWADVASMRLLSGVLGRLKNAPLMILALARPSVDEVHPRLWEEQRVSRFVLEPLLPKAAEKLARAVLGDDADVTEIVKRADGNPLFVEELARVYAEKSAKKDTEKSDKSTSDLPPTIAAAAEARLSTLPLETRQVLRAAAIVGERFWLGAVAALVGSSLAASVKMHLDTLEQLEVVSSEPLASGAAAGTANEQQYIFRHALVRDAAYAMLTDADRVIGHGLAAAWLESRARRAGDAAVLAQHYELGDRASDAARWHVAAAEDALAATDAAGVAKHVGSAERCAASSELLGRARLTQGEMALWKADNVTAGGAAREAMTLVERGTARWFNAAAIAAVAFGKLEDKAQTIGVVDEIEATPAIATSANAGAARAIARIRAAIQLAYFGELERTDSLLSDCEREPGAENDTGVRAWLCDAEFDRANVTGVPLHPSVFTRGRALYMKIGDRRGAIGQHGSQVFMLSAIGALDEALATLPEYESTAAELGFTWAKLGADWVRASCALVRGDVDPCLAFLPAMRRSMPRYGRMSAGVGVTLAEILILCDRVDEAAEEVTIGLRASENAPVYRGGFLAVSSMIKLRKKDVTGALEDSARAMKYAARAAPLTNAYLASLARFDALRAARLDEEARAVLRDAAATLTRRAANLREYGPGYLEYGFRTGELMKLAREHGV